MRRASPVAYDLIRKFEGLRLHAYSDAVGVMTIGYGHTASVEAGQKIDTMRAEQLLHGDVVDAVETIYAHVPGHVIDTLPQPSYDALVSFVFNVGSQAFARPNGGKTDFLRALLGPDQTEVARQMQRWTKGRVNGALTILPGLVRRRGAEAALWGSGLRVGQAARHVMETEGNVVPEPPRTKLLEQPATVAAAGAGAAGVAATALTSAGQGMTYSGDRIALIIGLALILVGAGIMVWMAQR